MKKIITFSFDDGCSEDFKTAELLAKYGFKATFYIANSHSHNPLQPNEIRQLSYLGEIGAHTRNHIRLDKLNYISQKKEIEYNKKYLEDIIGKSVDVFCPPKGYYNKKTLKIIKELGFAGMRTTKDFQIKFNNNYEMPTTLQLYPHKIEIMIYHLIKYNPQYFFFLFPYKLKSIEQILIFFNKIINLSGGVLHLWGHSWELEMFININYLKSILKLVESFNYESYYNSQLVL
ncbi:MAG: polysaccharide deacetylase family protein [Melioribacteraceae bacterium]